MCLTPALLYFDHNATTFVAPEVAETASAALRQVFGNASSTHREGQLARQQLEKSRRAIAEFLHISPAEFVFTSGGTEANNLAILGLVKNAGGVRKHVVTTAIEHPAVLETCRQLEREGVDVTYAPVSASGVVDAQGLCSAIRSETVLVSVMHANNEVGTVQPIEAIARRVRALRGAGQEVYFHSDGVQALGKIDVNLQELGADLYSVSAHKIFGPKGMGGLAVRKGTPLRGIQHGGRHERERRAGTENVPGAMAFARAVELCGAETSDYVATLRDLFETEVLARLSEVEINGLHSGSHRAGGREARLPNTSNLLFQRVSAEALVIALDMKGIAVSTGSACSSGSVEPSHVLLAMGRSRNEARASVRFSFGRYNSPEDVQALVEAVAGAVGKLRAAGRVEKHVVV